MEEIGIPGWGLLLTSVCRGSYSDASVGAEEGNTSQMVLLAFLLSQGQGALRQFLWVRRRWPQSCRCVVRRASRAQVSVTQNVCPAALVSGFPLLLITGTGNRYLFKLLGVQK